MNYRMFGATDLMVSEVGFGCARLGGIFENSSRADMLRTLHLARDKGITFFDTADMYCQGESEALLGRAFRRQRSSIIIASKAGYCLPARRKLASRIKPVLRPLIQRLGLKRGFFPSGLRGAVGQDFSATYLLSAVDQSLKRLGTDYLDLFQLHSPPPSVLESGEFITPLEKLKSQGKIRFYGVSCETTADALICLQYPGISALQVRLSLLDQGVLDEVLPRARERGVAIIARECYAGGLLARPVKELSLEEVIPDVVMREKKRQELVDCERTALSDGRSLPELALQFVLGLDGISTALLGMRSSAHLDTNMGYLAAPRLSQQVIRSLREYSAGSVAAR